MNIFGSPSDRQNISFSAGYRKSNGVGLRNSRLYGNQSWPFPSLTDELSFKNGIPSDGSYGSTDGNMKAAEIEFTDRVAQQVNEQIGDLTDACFIIDECGIAKKGDKIGRCCPSIGLVLKAKLIMDRLACMLLCAKTVMHRKSF